MAETTGPTGQIPMLQYSYGLHNNDMQSFQKPPSPQTLPVGSIRMALAQDTAASMLQGQDIHVSFSHTHLSINITCCKNSTIILKIQAESFHKACGLVYQNITNIIV
jgi:hypothetical protein